MNSGFNGLTAAVLIILAAFTLIGWARGFFRTVLSLFSLLLSLVIAWLKACVLYVANGCRWDSTFEDFVRWSLGYDLACKMEFFGADIEEALREEQRDDRPVPGRRNLLELLPDEFTYQDAVRVHQSEGMDAKGTGGMLRQWKSRRYVTIVTNDNYLKLKFRKDGNKTDKNSKA